MMPLPPRLYKYESLTAQTLQNLKGQILYFGSPLGFNDPYDCAMGDFDFVSSLFCTKSEAWSYEMEWRAIHAVAGTKYVYPAESLTGVYFGPDIDRESLEIVCLILQGQNENVKFWRGTRSATEFKVVFEEITYTPHIEARKNGLV